MTSPTPSEPRTGHQLYHATRIAPATAAKLVAASIATLYATQILMKALGTPDLLASMTSDLAVVAVVIAVALHRGWTAAHFGLRPVKPRFFVAGLLVGVSMWYLTAWLVALLQPPGDTQALERFVSRAALVPTIAAIALFPAIAEELIFRGILVRSLASHFRTGVAITISAAVFGLYHLFPPQMVSTFGFGLVLGFLTLRADSLVPAFIAHLLNNTIAIVLSRDEIPGANEWLFSHPAVVLAVAASCVAAAITLVAKGPS